MKRFASAMAILMATGFWVEPVRAQCNPVCQGDFDIDGQVTVDEIIISVNNALSGCGDSLERGCTDSGGTVSTGLCCIGVGDFPNTCSIGSCGCAPQSSSEVKICSCGPDTCFNPDQRACVPQ